MDGRACSNVPARSAAPGCVSGDSGASRFTPSGLSGPSCPLVLAEGWSRLYWPSMCVLSTRRWPCTRWLSSGSGRRARSRGPSRRAGPSGAAAVLGTRLLLWVLTHAEGLPSSLLYSQVLTVITPAHTAFHNRTRPATAASWSLGRISSQGGFSEEAGFQKDAWVGAPRDPARAAARPWSWGVAASCLGCCHLG